MAGNQTQFIIQTTNQYRGYYEFDEDVEKFNQRKRYLQVTGRTLITRFTTIHRT